MVCAGGVWLGFWWGALRCDCVSVGVRCGVRWLAVAAFPCGVRRGAARVFRWLPLRVPRVFRWLPLCVARVAGCRWLARVFWRVAGVPLGVARVKS